MPRLDWVLDHMNNWLVPAFGENLRLKADWDSVDALSVRREEKRTTYLELFKQRTVTRPELREALGYGKLPDMPDFDPLPEEVTAIVNLINSGNLSRATGLAELQRRGTIAKDVDLDNEAQLLEDERLATMASTGLVGMDANGDPIQPDPNADPNAQQNKPPPRLAVAK